LLWATSATSVTTTVAIWATIRPSIRAAIRPRTAAERRLRSPSTEAFPVQRGLVRRAIARCPTAATATRSLATLAALSEQILGHFWLVQILVILGLAAHTGGRR